jgi:hypothetical protein
MNATHRTAVMAAKMLDSARDGRYANPESSNTDALIAIGYALVALYEQGERHPEPAPARRWWQRGAR